MSEAAMQPLSYLDRAMGVLRNLGLVSDEPSSAQAPIVPILEQISDLDEERVVAITRTLAQASVFNEVVSLQVAAMEMGTRYERIANELVSIRDVALMMDEQIEDTELSFSVRTENYHMMYSR